MSFGPVSKIAILNVTWDLGSGQSIFLQGDRIAITGSTFKQSPNSQIPYSDGDSGTGPLAFGPMSNLLFRSNMISWASGQNLMTDLTNAVIEGNHFTRAADQITATAAQTSWPYVTKPIAVGQVIQRTQGRQLAINFGKYVVIHSNIFDTSGNTLQYNWDDGETILSEGGGPSPRFDAGTTTSASALTVADDSRCSGVCSWNYYPNSTVSIVTGAGAGQIRNIVSRNNNTFTIDQPWDVIPSPGDHFAIDVPSLSNTLIRYNTMTGNPRGVTLYAATFVNVSIIGNTMTNNGGIMLRPDQRQMKGPNGAQFHIGRARNIEINSNVLTNTKGLFNSYIYVSFGLNSPTSLWGMSMDGVEMRNNQITGLPGTPVYDAADGYYNYVLYANPNGPYVDNGVSTIIGTILQGDICISCAPNYILTTGDLDTVIWNAKTTVSPNVSAVSAVSSLTLDYKLSNTAPHASTGTTTGHD